MAGENMMLDIIFYIKLHYLNRSKSQGFHKSILYFFDQNFFQPNFFLTLPFLKTIFGLKFSLAPTCFSDQNFFSGSKFFFGPRDFLGQTIFKTKTFLGLKLFSDFNFFSDQHFLTANFFSYPSQINKELALFPSTRKIMRCTTGA